MVFARGIQVSASREVSVDIDPLAAGHPADRRTVVRESAASRREVPTAQTDAEEIRQARTVTENEIFLLLERIQEHALTRTAQVEHARLTDAAAADPAKLAGAVSELVDRQIQRVWNMLTFGIDGLKAQQQQQGLRGTTGLFDQLVARDKSSPSGLSQGAEASLQIARHALEGQLIADFTSGQLDEARLQALLGRGVGGAWCLGLSSPPLSQS